MLQTADRDIHGATLSRRFLLRGAGALTVGFALAGGLAGCANPPAAGVASKLASSWIRVGPDGTVAVHTGNSDFGQGTVFTAYRQIVADELYTTIQAITTVVTGDTDRTPDGGGSYALLFMGSPNIRKAAAYTYQALLDLAAQKLGTPRTAITAEDGVFHGGGRSVAYGDLVRDQTLNLTIPVQDMEPMGLRISGDPPTKPVSAYKYVGQSFDNSAIAARVTARAEWITDVRLPGMLHARMVRPKTLGSTLVSAGTVDKARFPGAQVVVKGNLVAVVSPSEWEAVQAAQHVADGTRWTDWKGLPGHERLPEALRNNDWAATPISRDSFFGPPQAPDAPERARRAIAGAARTLKASYFMPYLKHAPIGPTIAVADVRPDGTTIVHAHNQNAQLLRRAIATMLGASPDNVVVRSYAGPGHYGRSNAGVSGAEDEAVILSRELGKPVRVQWMRDEDIQWSTQQAAAYSDIEIGLDAQGHMTGYQAEHFMPAMTDGRPIGAVLAGLPTQPAPAPGPDPTASTVNRLWDDWIYGAVKDVAQTGHGGSQIGLAASPLKVGLRDQSMRTPGQFQQNFPREAALTEAAALAGADPLAFRLAHVTDPRVKGVLEAVRDASGWQTRATPAHGAGQGGDVVRGRGVSNMYRAESYWACVAEVAVTRSTGVVKVEKITVAVDPGIVINPKQLKRQVEGGVTMGVSQALFEEVRFDESHVTSLDWTSYPILTMADLPEIKVVLLHKPEIGVYGGGSEAANALPAAAIVGAVHDATGVFARRLPLTPAYVGPLLRTGTTQT